MSNWRNANEDAIVQRLEAESIPGVKSIKAVVDLKKDLTAAIVNPIAILVKYTGCRKGENSPATSRPYVRTQLEADFDVIYLGSNLRSSGESRSSGGLHEALQGGMDALIGFRPEQAGRWLDFEDESLLEVDPSGSWIAYVQHYTTHEYVQGTTA